MDRPEAAWRRPGRRTKAPCPTRANVTIIKYSLKKDKTVSPPAYYVFFRAKDIDAMTAAFKEYSNDVAKKQARPSIRKKLAKAMEAVRNTLSTQRERHKHHEHSR